MNNKFIVLEGLSGVGKTTLGKQLCEEYNMRYVYIPNTDIKSVRKYIHSTNIQTRFLYYLTALSDASRIISEALQTQSVVCDRYVYSTIAYHQAAGVNEELLSIVKKINLVQPDKVIHIGISRELRYQRLTERGEKPGSEWEQMKARNKQAKAFFNQVQTHFLDNSGSKEQLFQNAIKIIGL